MALLPIFPANCKSLPRFSRQLPESSSFPVEGPVDSMAETVTTLSAVVSDHSRSTPDDKDFVAETIYDLLPEDWKSTPGPEKISNRYIALDVTKLSLLAATAEEINKTLPRKGSQRGIERKAPESAATAAVSVTGGERSACLLHVSCLSDNPTIPTAEAVVGTGRFRHLSVRRPSRWLDPRRVLLFFASLSSLGTMILLYFTLSIGKYSGR